MPFIPLSNSNKWAEVDAEDFEDLLKYKWSELTGYARSGHLIMHRLIMGLESNDKRVVDHISGDRLDNKKENLRICTSHQNSLNRKAIFSTQTGYKGVTLIKKNVNKPYKAMITLNKKAKFLGCYSTAEEAAEAYNKAAKELHGKYARLNENKSKITLKKGNTSGHGGARKGAGRKLTGKELFIKTGLSMQKDTLDILKAIAKAEGISISEAARRCIKAYVNFSLIS